MSASRAPVAAAEAERQALARAARAKLTSFEWRVLGGVIALTASYDRLVDRIFVAQVAAFAFGFGFGRLPDPEPSEKARRDWRVVEARRALKRLRERGIVVYEPARGRGHPSLIGLPRAEKARAATPLLDEKRARVATPLFGDKRHGNPALKGAASFPRPTEELPKRKRARGDNEDPKAIRAWLSEQRTEDGEPLHPLSVDHAIRRIVAMSYSRPKAAALKIAREEHHRIVAERADEDRRRAARERTERCAKCNGMGVVEIDDRTARPCPDCREAAS